MSGLFRVAIVYHANFPQLSRRVPGAAVLSTFDTHGMRFFSCVEINTYHTGTAAVRRGSIRGSGYRSQVSACRPSDVPGTYSSTTVIDARGPVVPVSFSSAVVDMAAENRPTCVTFAFGTGRASDFGRHETCLQFCWLNHVSHKTFVVALKLAFSHFCFFMRVW